MQTTRVTVYRPFVGGRLSPRLRVTKTVKGECFSGSSANPRRDAWRCSAGKLHLRPLFLRPEDFSWARRLWDLVGLRATRHRPSRVASVGR